MKLSTSIFLVWMMLATTAYAAMFGPFINPAPILNPATTQYYIDAARTDTYIPTGTITYPFRTIASAVAEAVSDGRTDSNPAFNSLAGKIAESVTLTRGGIFFNGLNSVGSDSPIVVTGTWAISGVDGNITANHFAITNLSLSGNFGTPVIAFSGGQAQRLFLTQDWLTSTGSGATCLTANNTGVGSVINADILKLSMNAASSVDYALDLTNVTMNVSDLESSGTTSQVAIVRSGATLTICCTSEIDASGVQAVSVLAGGTLTISNSEITNTQANSSGLNIANGGVAALGNVNFNVPIGTGYAITGAAGSVVYYKNLSFTPGSNISINPLVTMVPIQAVPETPMTNVTTVVASTHATGFSDSNLIYNFAGTVTETLPSAALYPGRTLTLKTITANTVISASSNVVPLAGGAAGTAILAATAGKYAVLTSNGTAWQIMQGN